MKFFAHSTEQTDKENWQPLKEHLENVASLAGEFALPMGQAMGQEVVKMVKMAGLLHDIGKYTKEFQDRLSGDNIRVNHSTRGAEIAIKKYGPNMGYFIAYAIAGHHAGLANGSGEGRRRGILEVRLSLNSIKKLPSLCNQWKNEISLDTALSCPGKFKWGNHEMFQCAFLMRMIFSCLVDADFLDTEKFSLKVKKKVSKRRCGRVTFRELSEKLDIYLVELEKRQGKTKKSQAILDDRRKIREAVNENSKLEQGIFSLTVPTGGGKTLTSLSFALRHALQHGLNRVIYVAPFTSIIDQNADVFRKVFKDSDNNIVLPHHSSFISREDKGKPDQYQSFEKLKLAMENWDYPIVATTAVQFFESLFSGRTSMCRKLHNITNSVVILDEAQTIPLHLLRPCIEALKELSLNYRTSIVLCTATQPALKEEDGFKEGFKDIKELAPEPQNMFERFKRVTVRDIGDIKDDQLVDKIQGHKQVLCIVNSRPHATYLFEKIKENSPSEKNGIYHLTTAMCAEHRSVVLKKIRYCLKNHLTCRLVATSLIEAGVDIDFPFVLRAQCGLDSIAQAAGRCNREGERDIEESLVEVFSSDERNWKIPHEIRQRIDSTKGIFGNDKFKNDFLGLDAIREYFNNLFWKKGSEKLDEEGILEDFSCSKRKSIPFEEVEKKFCMIKKNYQKPIIVNYQGKISDSLEKLKYDPYCYKFARKIQPYVIQIPEKSYNNLMGAGAIELVAQEKFGEQFALLANEKLYKDDRGLDWSNPSFIDACDLVIC